MIIHSILFIIVKQKTELHASLPEIRSWDSYNSINETTYFEMGQITWSN